MTKTWLISDTHFGHEKTWSTFKNADGTPLRPFTSTEEMDREMVQRWNAVVSDQDRVYHLGDVVIARKNLSILHALKGRKKLVRGNHDIFNLKDYAEFFDDILGSHKLDDLILSHIPLHEGSIARWCGGNVHGHLHGTRVLEPKWGKIDTRYFCVSVENIDFRPIELNELKARMAKEKNG